MLTVSWCKQNNVEDNVDLKKNKKQFVFDYIIWPSVLVEDRGDLLKMITVKGIHCGVDFEIII
uniref:Uncharacterized protein n=1 Tax=Anguilla anguilla TaxID=7936 RepID=A0A0E9XKH6_ANGAN